MILEVDKETGKTTILKAALAIDAGKAVHPELVKGQIVGGIVQGLATALYEDIRYAPNGRLLNPNFTDYKIPTALDCPQEIVPIILETPQPDGPFGARGVAEHTMIACAPMVADAIADAIGVRLQTMPLTAEKVALALRGIDYDEVKGDNLGFCFRAAPATIRSALPANRIGAADDRTGWRYFVSAQAICAARRALFFNSATLAVRLFRGLIR